MSLKLICLTLKIDFRIPNFNFHLYDKQESISYVFLLFYFKYQILNIRIVNRIVNDECMCVKMSIWDPIYWNQSFLLTIMGWNLYTNHINFHTPKILVSSLSFNSVEFSTIIIDCLIVHTHSFYYGTLFLYLFLVGSRR